MFTFRISKCHHQIIYIATEMYGISIVQNLFTMKITFYLLLFILVAALAAGGWYYSRFRGERSASSIVMEKGDSLLHKTLQMADRLKNYNTRQYNTKIGFLMDMSIESGKNRFFLMDLEKDSVMSTALVTHGRCNQNWLSGRKYSNVVGSGCTSLGRYRVGKSYYGQFGLAYKLHGLDSTNNNAFKRYVVLHSHECVPDKETHPLPLCQSDGCPTVSKAFLQELKSVIDTASKPIILWIYE